MKIFTKSKSDFEACFNDYENYSLYMQCVNDMLQNKVVFSMEKFIQHNGITCFVHCVHVSFISFKICRHLRLDYHSAARGGLLHDFFLYDWHDHEHEGWHGFRHAEIALNNANKYFSLNDIEKDIIVKHMWPMNRSLPKFIESYVIVATDKYCAVIESVLPGVNHRLNKLTRIVNDKEMEVCQLSQNCQI